MCVCPGGLTLLFRIPGGKKFACISWQYLSYSRLEALTTGVPLVSELGLGGSLGVSLGQVPVWCPCVDRRDGREDT